METLVESSKAEIRPFRINFPESDLIELRRRISASKWPENETVTDASQGVQTEMMKNLMQYWQTQYDWRKVEARLNALPQFVTKIDGLDIHFIHIRSKHENALPLIVTHGWPGSIIEQLKIIDPLTNPTAHGGSADDAFHLVIPSLPGFGFSEKPTSPGWGPPRVAKAWDTLMKRLGYKRYVAQGGDLGSVISETMARFAPEGLLGIHVNLYFIPPPEIAKALGTNQPAPAGLSEQEKLDYQKRMHFQTQSNGYLIEMTLRPQTIGYSITDSPIGLASWLLDHDSGSYDLISRAFEGKSEGLTRDDVLDNITLYWLTNTGASASRSYWEGGRARAAAAASGVSPPQIKIPVAVSVFPNEIFGAPRSWVEKSYPNLSYYHEVEKGGHFAAWEQPQLFAYELRAAFKPLR